MRNNKLTLRKKTKNWRTSSKKTNFRGNKMATQGSRLRLRSKRDKWKRYLWMTCWVKMKEKMPIQWFDYTNFKKTKFKIIIIARYLVLNF